MTPAGSQEAADSSAALDRVANEMGTLQRNAHAMAVQVAEAEARIDGSNITVPSWNVLVLRQLRIYKRHAETLSIVMCPGLTSTRHFRQSPKAQT